jgi:hypothetical protein
MMERISVELLPWITEVTFNYHHHSDRKRQTYPISNLI